MTPADHTIVEAILMVADEPVPAGLMGEVLERDQESIRATLETLAESHERDDRGFRLREVAGGWRLYTSPSCAPWLERFIAGHGNARLTGAALEVLAIVAYRQPISRSQISELRGVDSDGVVRTLLQRRLIVESGRERSGAAPALFSVSPEFVERMGLGSVDDLPPLPDFMPDTESVKDMEDKLSPPG